MVASASSAIGRSSTRPWVAATHVDPDRLRAQHCCGTQIGKRVLVKPVSLGRVVLPDVRIVYAQVYKRQFFLIHCLADFANERVFQCRQHAVPYVRGEKLVTMAQAFEVTEDIHLPFRQKPVKRI
jgi:hypothetical protein